MQQNAFGGRSLPITTEIAHEDVVITTSITLSSSRLVRGHPLLISFSIDAFSISIYDSRSDFITLTAGFLILFYRIWHVLSLQCFDTVG